MNLDYQISTRVAGPMIVQEVSTGGMFADLHEVVMRNVINTQEQQVREALIALGWTPPDDREKCPFCGLLTDRPCDSPPPTMCDTQNEAMLRAQRSALPKVPR